MIKSLLIPAVVLLLVVGRTALSDNAVEARPDANPIAQSQAETNLISVVIKNVGKRRTSMKPIVLYADEGGWNIRSWVLTPSEEKQVSGEKCGRNVLDKLFISVKARQDWIPQGEYGNTQVIFFRDDTLQQSFTLDKTNITLAVQSIKSDLPTNSIVWKFLRVVNRDFPPAKE